MANKSTAAIWKEYEQYLGIGSEPKPPKHFPSGITALNAVLSHSGGIPGGSIIQIIGENGHGKSTLAMDLLAQAQKSGLEEVSVGNKVINAVVLDFERSFDPIYAELFGIDSSKVLVVRTPYAEQSFSIAERLLLDGVQFILIDSIGMLVAQDEEDKDYDDSEKVAAEAKALGRFIKRANAFMTEQALVVIINQYRANMNKMGHAPDKKAYGARLVQYAAKLSLELRRVQQSDDRDFIEVFVQKNKLGGKKGIKIDFQIVSTEGIDYAQHSLDLAEEFGIIAKRGAWYYYPGYSDFTHKAQGKEKAKTDLPMTQINEEIVKYLLDRDGE